MAKNDYRRTLIMLRSHREGYSGHVRMERRVMTGSLYFVVNVPSEVGELCAALIRRDRKGNYGAVSVGTLRRDGRGQANLAYSFDPRNIDGYPLDEYYWVAVVRRDGDNCEMVLSGNVDGARDADWDAVRTAACGLCGAETRERAAEIPERDEREDSPEAEDGDGMSIDTSVPWKGASEALRKPFSELPIAELMLGDGFMYVLAAMPEGGEIALGVQTQDGIPQKIAYAVRGNYAEEPPEGLEGYRWVGGSSEGWWVLYADADTGEPI